MAIDPNTPSLSAASHIEQTADVCSGKPRIIGTRIRVQDVVVWHERLGLSADEIVSRWPQLTLADVYAALTFYHDHRAEIDAAMESGRKSVQEIQTRYPSKLDRRSLSDE
jgi:uncharacterized protein (DUF433 family)